MNRTLKHKQTLVYYDGPELFIGNDAIGSSYLCLLVEAKSDSEQYLCVPISNRRLNEFLCGKIDLRTICIEPEMGELYISSIDDPQTKEITLSRIEQSDVSPAWLPDPGFYLVEDKEIDEEIMAEAMDRNRLIIHYSLDPPESRSEYKIAINHLSQGLRLFQRLIDSAYHKAIQSMDAIRKHELDRPEYYTLNAIALSPGSFTVHLEPTAIGDMYGYSELAKALDLIDSLTGKIGDIDSSLEILKANSGHFAAAYKHFLDFIANTDSPVKYKWVMPDRCASINRQLPREAAVKLYEVLDKSEELSRVEIELEGIVMKVDVDSGTWRIRVLAEEQSYRGRCDPDSDIHLGGIITETQLYRFKCIERLEEHRGTGRERRILLLQSFEPIET